jgi:hypothetical protein
VAPGRTSHQSAWLIAFFLGAIDGIIQLELGVVGMAITLAALGMLAWKGTRLAVLAGLLAGFGGAWTFLFGRVLVNCAVENAATPGSCGTGDLGGWVAAALSLLAIGATATVVAARRARVRS